jgi:hypothetical protein
VSHDCDIASDPEDEPEIEIVVGTGIEACRRENINARHVRILHLEFQGPGGAMPLELVATNKRSVSKLDFLNHRPDPNFVLSDKELQGLRSWLAARYRRAAIPDGLQRLVKQIFEDVFKKSDRPRALDKIYIDFEPDAEELPPGEKYELDVVLVYDSQQAGAKEVAEKAAEQLKFRFERKYLKGKVWNEVELRRCDTISNTSFTLFDVQQHKQVRLEYLSIKLGSTAEPYDE